jgi:dihydropteroate synthase
MVAARHNMRAGELAGVNRGLMLIDPDFGFCKTFTRPDASRRAAAVDSARIMVGISQMGVLEAFTGRLVEQRVTGSSLLYSLRSSAGQLSFARTTEYLNERPAPSSV